MHEGELLHSAARGTEKHLRHGHVAMDAIGLIAEHLLANGQRGAEFIESPLLSRRECLLRPALLQRVVLLLVAILKLYHARLGRLQITQGGGGHEIALGVSGQPVHRHRAVEIGGRTLSPSDRIDGVVHLGLDAGGLGGRHLVLAQAEDLFLECVEIHAGRQRCLRPAIERLIGAALEVGRGDLPVSGIQRALRVARAHPVRAHDARLLRVEGADVGGGGFDHAAILNHDTAKILDVARRDE